MCTYHGQYEVNKRSNDGSLFFFILAFLFVNASFSNTRCLNGMHALSSHFPPTRSDLETSNIVVILHPSKLIVGFIYRNDDGTMALESKLFLCL